jgi:hypothetical protein
MGEKKKETQKELPGMPAVSDLARECLDFLKIKEGIESAKERLENKKMDVAEQFRAAGKKTIKVSGHTFSFSEFNQIKITVKQE